MEVTADRTGPPRTWPGASLPREVRCSITSGDLAPGAARCALDSFVEDDFPRGRRADARLVLGELVSNSVRHAGSGSDQQIELALASSASALQVDVTDHGRGFDPAAARSRDVDRVHGRGLLLVDALADDWGVRNDGSSTCVWFRIGHGAAEGFRRTRARHLPAVGRSAMEGTWPAVVASVTPIRHFVVAWAALAGATGQALDDIALAVSEAVTNACVHAFVDAPRPGSVTVAAGIVSATHVRMVVADDGCGLAPRTDSPGGGLGLALIAQIADDLAITHARGGGTVVRMLLPLTRAG